MKIIELCGKPGVGKSTLVNEFKDKVSSQILFREDIIDRGVLPKKVRRYSFYFIYKLFPMGEIKKIKRIISQLDNVDLKYVYRFFSIYKGLKRYEEKDVVIILEEGPLQYISSLVHLTNIEDAEFLYELIPLFKNWDLRFILCECDNEECARRIYNRRKNKDRFFDEDINRIKSKIEIKEKNIKLLLDKFERNVVQINMEDNIEKNVEMLIDMLRTV